jgi:hypothetical protein
MKSERLPCGPRVDEVGIEASWLDMSGNVKGMQPSFQNLANLSQCTIFHVELTRIFKDGLAATNFPATTQPAAPPIKCLRKFPSDRVVVEAGRTPCDDNVVHGLKTANTILHPGWATYTETTRFPVRGRLFERTSQRPKPCRLASKGVLEACPLSDQPGGRDLVRDRCLKGLAYRRPRRHQGEFCHASMNSLLDSPSKGAILLSSGI